MRTSFIGGLFAATLIGITAVAAQAPVETRKTVPGGDIKKEEAGTPPASMNQPNMKGNAAKGANPAKANLGNKAWCTDTRDTSGGAAQVRCDYASQAECNKAIQGQQGNCVARSATTGSGARRQ